MLVSSVLYKDSIRHFGAHAHVNCPLQWLYWTFWGACSGLVSFIEALLDTLGRMLVSSVLYKDSIRHFGPTNRVWCPLQDSIRHSEAPSRVCCPLQEFIAHLGIQLVCVVFSKGSKELFSCYTIRLFLSILISRTFIHPCELPRVFENGIVAEEYIIQHKTQQDSYETRYVSFF